MMMMYVAALTHQRDQLTFLDAWKLSELQWNLYFDSNTLLSLVIGGD